MLYTEKLKSLIEVPYVALLKVQVPSINFNLISSCSVFPDRVIHFGENLGDQVKGHFPKKLNSLIEVPYVALLNVQALKLQY